MNEELSQIREQLTRIEIALKGYDGRSGMIGQLTDHERKLEELGSFRARLLGIAVGASILISVAIKKIFG